MKEAMRLGVAPILFENGRIRWLVLLALGLILFMASDVAMAQTDAFVQTSLSNGLLNLIATLNGTVARSLAIIAVIGSGVAALTGRMEWSKAVVVVLGVGIVFSATSMIDAMFGLTDTN